jgi:hypothetical protein
MVQKCGPQIFACVNDPDCKAALDCLQACDPTDQVLMPVVAGARPSCSDDSCMPAACLASASAASSYTGVLISVHRDV